MLEKRPEIELGGDRKRAENFEKGEGGNTEPSKMGGQSRVMTPKTPKPRKRLLKMGDLTPKTPGNVVKEEMKKDVGTPSVKLFFKKVEKINKNPQLGIEKSQLVKKSEQDLVFSVKLQFK